MSEMLKIILDQPSVRRLHVFVAHERSDGTVCETRMGRAPGYWWGICSDCKRVFRAYGDYPDRVEELG